MEPRIRDIGTLLPEIGDVTGALLKATGNGSVPSTTITLIYLRAGQIVGSTYQTMRHSRDLRKAGESEERIGSVVTWWDAPYFTEAERAALALTEATFQPSPSGKVRVPDEVFAAAAKHYDERAMATLTAVLASAAYWMAIALVLNPPPVRELARSA
jgi:alkylhydroperoxidase family enzyme